MINVSLDQTGSSVTILDQTKLPNQVEYRRLSTAEDIHEAIVHLRVRGAPAIGICAAFGMYVLSRSMPQDDRRAFLEGLSRAKEYLASARPTAVNLRWALDRMEKVASEASPALPVPKICEMLKAEALAIQKEDMDMCRRIAEYGLTLVKNGDGILTHCNAGPLATSRYGTALGPIFLAKERGIDLKVFADETRPLLQGARLTSYELERGGVDVTLICDNMASMVMKNGWIQACFVGCDRVAANGDTANKIGTSGVAILAKHYGIPFYVLGPSSTIDLDCPTGDDIPIELRAPQEIKEMFYSQPMALPETKCYNPAFDVTDHSLITAIVTDQGIFRAPYSESLRKIKKTNAWCDDQ